MAKNLPAEAYKLSEEINLTSMMITSIQTYINIKCIERNTKK